MGIVAPGQGQVVHVRVEVLLALDAIMLRIGNLHVDRSVGLQIPHIVQRASDDPVTIARSFTLRAGATFVVSRASNDSRLREVFNPRNAFCNIRLVCARSVHVGSPAGNLLDSRRIPRQSNGSGLNLPGIDATDSIRLVILAVATTNTVATKVGFESCHANRPMMGRGAPFLIKQLLNSSTYYSSSPFLAFASP
jgi:hypothetical protein